MNEYKNCIFDLAVRVSKSRTLRAIQDGYLLIIPIVVIDSFVLLFLFLPIPAYQAVLKDASFTYVYTGLKLVHTSCSAYFSLLLSGAVGWGIARKWGLPLYHALLLPVLSICCLFIFTGIGTGHFNVSYLGMRGMFSALLAAIIAGRLYVVLFRYMPTYDQGFSHRVHVDFQAMDSFRSLFPMIGVVTFCAVVHQGFIYMTGGFTAQQTGDLIIYYLVTSMAEESRLLVGNLYTFLVHMLWLMGIHGQYSLYVITQNYYSSLLQQNIAAVQMGLEPRYIINSAFNSTYVCMGGAGSALALVIAIFYKSRDKEMRMIAKAAAFPVLFNVSEILNFGIPIILNPVFAVPFVLVPLVNFNIAYFFTAIHVLPVITRHLSWTTPPFLDSYMASGSWRGPVLQLVLLCVDVLLYIPFVSWNEKIKQAQFIERVHHLEQYFRQLEHDGTALQLHALGREYQATAVTLMKDLVRDFHSERMYVVYQPQFDDRRRFTGAEVLLRWNHAKAGFVYPPLIIALARIGRVMAELDQFVFEEACAAISRLERVLCGAYTISVNVTADSLQHAGLEQQIHRALQKYNVAPSRLSIEITEQEVMHNTIQTIAKISRLKAEGHQFLLDDFGMGHTSVTYLKENLFDAIKLDSTITRDVLTNRNHQIIIASMVTMSKTLHMQVVAEHVENAAQRDKLEALGCDIFQGYLYSKPVSLEDILGTVKKWQCDMENCQART
ncbi:EAL domain-containing protein [Megasphaera paucivorans]|uniref:Diguanylate phosphodiesterase n=1 Tax=Megasphaera paucivorans TaxID=349095 RepID=A0A1H0A4P6_9FIRM|nr:EAL domain-containing protein [Megasphaera paucivorans]SDN28528.1 diguanylate phosphodiesterase [Megasphaera paucivorans]